MSDELIQDLQDMADRQVDGTRVQRLCLASIAEIGRLRSRIAEIEYAFLWTTDPDGTEPAEVMKVCLDIGARSDEIQARPGPQENSDGGKDAG